MFDAFSDEAGVPFSLDARCLAAFTPQLLDGGSYAAILVRHGSPTLNQQVMSA